MAALPVLAYVALASAAVAAAGAVYSADAQRKAAHTNADIAANNALMSEQQGEAQSQMQQRQARLRMGDAVAQYGANGVSTDAGSAVDVLRNSAANAELDRLTIKYNGGVRSWGYGNEGMLDNMQARNATTAGNMQAGSDILQGISSAYGYQGRMGTQGAGNQIQL